MTTTFALAAMALVIAAALVLIRLHTLPTGLDPRRDAISDYGTTHFHLYYRAMVVLLGAGAACLALALHRSGDVRTSGLVWLWIFAAARVLIAGFMTVRRERRATLESQIHLLLAAAAFTAIAFAATTVSSDLDLAHTLATLVAVAAASTLVSRAVRRLAPVFGIVERLLYAAFVAWLVVVASSLAS
jgi:Protein of unknown function (DUF998)